MHNCIITLAYMRCSEMIDLIASGTYAKSLTKPDLHTNECGHR